MTQVTKLTQFTEITKLTRFTQITYITSPSGRVRKWEYSYGFIEVTEPKEHKKAGAIFAHISDFKNREGHSIE